MNDRIVFGSRMIPVTLPERTRFVPQGLSTALPPVENLAATLEEAFRRPLDRPPLRDTAKPEFKVTASVPRGNVMLTLNRAKLFGYATA